MIRSPRHNLCLLLIVLLQLNLRPLFALNTFRFTDIKPSLNNILKDASLELSNFIKKSLSTTSFSSSFDLFPSESLRNNKENNSANPTNRNHFHKDDDHNRRANVNTDLDGLNAVLSDIRLNMDDFLLEDLQSPFPAGSKLYGSNFFCNNFHIGSLGFTGSMAQDKLFAQNSFSIRGIILYCQFNWKLTNSGGGSLGNGLVKIDTRNSFMETDVKYVTDSRTNLGFYPPLSSSIENCDAAIVVRDISVTGSGRRFFMSLISLLLQTLITVTIGGELCNAFSSSEYQDVLSEQFIDVARQIDPYLSLLTASGVDVLSAQKNIDEESEASNYLDYTNQQEQSFFGGLLQNFIMNNQYGKIITNSNGNEDLFINELIRKSGYLTESGYYEVIMNEQPDDQQTSQYLPIGLRVNGFDSLTYFSPINTIAPQTLQTAIQFKGITFAYVMRWLYESDPNAISPEGFHVCVPDFDEYFAIQGEFSDVTIISSLFAPVNTTAIGSLTLNEFLKMDCSTQYFFNSGMNLTQLEVTYSEFEFPEVQSLFAPGLDGFLNGFSQAYRDLYQSAIYKALPNYIATTFREEQQLALDSYVEGVISSAQCSDFVSSNPEGFVDFRDLLLSRSDATKAGGSGTQPYGDMISSILDSIDGNYVSACDDGSPRINSLLSSEFTMDYSLSCKKSVTDNNKQIEIRRRNLSFENANTFSEPFVVMEPHHQETANVERLREPYIFDNAVTVGVGGENPFRVSMDIDVMVPNDDDEGMEKNLLRVTIDASNLSMSASILAKMVETAFMSLSVDEAVNPYCLLSTIASAGEEAIARSSASVLSLLDLVVSYDELKMEVECVSCENVYLLSLIEENEGNFDEEVKSMIEDVLKSVRTGDIQSWIDGLLEDAEYKCKAANGSIDCMDLIGPSMLRESSEIFFARLLDPTLGTETETEPEFFSGDSLDPEEVTPEDVESLDSEDITPPGVTPEDLQDSLDNNFAASTSGSLSTIQLEKYPLYLSFFLSSFSALRRHVVFSNFAFLHVYYKVCNDTSS